MKKPRILSLLLAIILFSAACGIPTVAPNATITVATDIPQPTAPPEPVLDLPAVDGEIAYASFDGNTSKVMVMYADGSNQTDLTSEFGEFSYPAWSPDGQRISMRINDIGGIAIMDLQVSGNVLSGIQPTTIFSEFSDASDWSPDGNQLVFMASGSTGWDLNLYTVDSSNVSQIPSISPWFRDPKWSPDGQKILFGADVDNNGNSDIYLVNLDGSGLTRLTSNDYYEGSPNWSPDGQRIVFSANANDNQDLFIMNLDGSGLMQLTSDPADEFDAAWSPDGTRIAFVSTRNDTEFGNNYEIYLINIDGSVEMRLTNNQSNDRWPDWRPASTANGQPNCQSQVTSSVDATIQAGTRFTRPTNFNKIWHMENTGQCTFTPNAFRLRFSDGDLMDAPVSIYMPGAIPPGSSVDIAVQFTSPSTPGIYNSNWQLLDASGIPVPDSSGNPLKLSVNIEVLARGENLLPAPLFFLRGNKDAQQVWRLDTDGYTLTQLTQESSGVTSFEINPVDNSLAYISYYQLVLLDAISSNRQVFATGDENNNAS
ncbi:MAG: NBR1-Ig-like domain-containing protein, partial [Chloroflexota bacterium]